MVIISLATKMKILVVGKMHGEIEDQCTIPEGFHYGVHAVCGFINPNYYSILARYESLHLCD